MEDDVVELKRIISRMQNEKWDYLKEDKKYLHTVMESMDLERLPQVLDQLNYKELKMAMGAGIHGDAWQFAKDKIKKFEAELNKFIEGDNSSITVPAEDLTSDDTTVGGKKVEETSKVEKAES